MNTTLWIILGTLLLIAHAFLFVDFYKTRRTRVSKQQIPMITALFIGPLYYFILTNHQRKERRSFMENKRRFS